MEVVILRIANNHESADDMNECCEPQLSAKSFLHPIWGEIPVNWNGVEALRIADAFLPMYRAWYL